MPATTIIFVGAVLLFLTSLINHNETPSIPENPEPARHQEDSPQPPERPEHKPYYESFETGPTGPLPDGFRAETTNPRRHEACWAVHPVSSAPHGKRALVLFCGQEGLGNRYNLCWTNQVSLCDGELSIKVLSGAGREDRGGGPAWRIKDKNNYYVSRWNPLENNFRIYSVKNGRRVQIASADVVADPAAWHTITMRHTSSKIEGYFDGKKLLEVEDSTHREAGGIGAWTKADAESIFDELRAAPEKN